VAPLVVAVGAHHLLHHRIRDPVQQLVERALAVLLRVDHEAEEERSPAAGPRACLAVPSPCATHPGPSVGSFRLVQAATAFAAPRA